MEAESGAFPYLRMSGRPRLSIVRQAAATECGLACVAMVASYLGVEADLVQLRRRRPASLKGATLKDVATTCSDLGLTTRAVTCRVSELATLRTPCILHWRFDHFVVLKAVNRDHLVIHDPARGVLKDSFETARNAFTGVALEVSRAAAFRRAKRPLQLRLSGLLSPDAAIAGKFSAGLALALVCELLMLASPFYLQAVIDQVLVKGDRILLNTLAIGFAGLLLFQVAANTMRQLTFQYLSQVTVFDMTTRVLHKLMKLPLGYFRSRDLGDIQHRVQSLRRVQNFIVQSAPALVLDTLFIILITALMLVYDRDLTLLAVAAAFAWWLWRALIFPLSLRRAGDIALTESSVQTHFLETLRAVQTVKMVNGEAARESEWQNLFANNINARISAGNLQIVDSALRQTLFQGVRIFAIYVLAKNALNGQISVGMVSAFVAYLGMFVGRCGGIVDRIMEYRLLEIPLNRLADIVFGDVDEAMAGKSPVLNPSGGVELKDVVFRYAESEAPILRGCSCSIPEDGFTAIAGRSGSGKSTLLRLIAGIESVSEGELTVGGVPARDWPAKALRDRIAAVFQDDFLIKGSVADNIALFEATPDRRRMMRAAADACIAAEVESMPMGYETRIGDLGSAFSKGQVQRVLLARALYRRAPLLLLDEPTSGLDSALEKRVVDTISRLDSTRIVVTHSDRMLQEAHEVLWLSEGSLLSSRPELN